MVSAAHHVITLTKMKEWQKRTKPIFVSLQHFSNIFDEDLNRGAEELCRNADCVHAETPNIEF